MAYLIPDICTEINSVWVVNPKLLLPYSDLIHRNPVQREEGTNKPGHIYTESSGVYFTL